MPAIGTQRRLVLRGLDANVTCCEENSSTVAVVYGLTKPVAEVDGTSIVEVVSNLSNNAIKFSPAGSTLEVALTKEGKNATISVKDSGRE